MDSTPYKLISVIQPTDLLMLKYLVSKDSLSPEQMDLLSATADRLEEEQQVQKEEAEKEKKYNQEQELARVRQRQEEEKERLDSALAEWESDMEFLQKGRERLLNDILNSIPIIVKNHAVKVNGYSFLFFDLKWRRRDGGDRWQFTIDEIIKEFIHLDEFQPDGENDSPVRSELWSNHKKLLFDGIIKELIDKNIFTKCGYLFVYESWSDEEVDLLVETFGYSNRWDLWRENIIYFIQTVNPKTMRLALDGSLTLPKISPISLLRSLKLGEKLDVEPYSDPAPQTNQTVPKKQAVEREKNKNKESEKERKASATTDKPSPDNTKKSRSVNILFVIGVLALLAYLLFH